MPLADVPAQPVTLVTTGARRLSVVGVAVQLPPFADSHADFVVAAAHDAAAPPLAAVYTQPEVALQGLALSTFVLSHTEGSPQTPELPDVSTTGDAFVPTTIRIGWAAPTPSGALHVKDVIAVLMYLSLIHI